MNCPAEKSEPAVAIKQAFTRLVFTHGYDSVSVQRVAADAGVARSTFYEHFAGKADVLRACMSGFFEVVADCVGSDAAPESLSRILDHLWANRRLTDAIFSGQARVVLVRNQTNLIEGRLRQLSGGHGGIIPSRFAASALAEMQIAMIEYWLRGRVHCDLSALAEGLHRASRACTLALV